MPAGDAAADSRASRRSRSCSIAAVERSLGGFSHLNSVNHEKDRPSRRACSVARRIDINQAQKESQLSSIPLLQESTTLKESNPTSLTPPDNFDRRRSLRREHSGRHTTPISFDDCCSNLPTTKYTLETPRCARDGRNCKLPYHNLPARAHCAPWLTLQDGVPEKNLKNPANLSSISTTTTSNGVYHESFTSDFRKCRPPVPPLHTSTRSGSQGFGRREMPSPCTATLTPSSDSPGAERSTHSDTSWRPPLWHRKKNRDERQRTKRNFAPIQTIDPAYTAPSECIRVKASSRSNSVGGRPIRRNDTPISTRDAAFVPRRKASGTGLSSPSVCMSSSVTTPNAAPAFGFKSGFISKAKASDEPTGDELSRGRIRRESSGRRAASVGPLRRPSLVENTVSPDIVTANSKCSLQDDFIAADAAGILELQLSPKVTGKQEFERRLFTRAMSADKFRKNFAIHQTETETATSVTSIVAESRERNRWHRHQKHTVDVYIRVYDISRGHAARWSHMVLGQRLEGVWHSGVLVYGKEYFYGGGIFRSTPAIVEAAYKLKPAKVHFLGSSEIPQGEFEAFLRRIASDFRIETYDIVNWNCNHFATLATLFLLGKELPQYILEVPRVVLTSFFGALIVNVVRSFQNLVVPFNNPKGNRVPAPNTKQPRDVLMVLARAIVDVQARFAKLPPSSWPAWYKGRAANFDALVRLCLRKSPPSPARRNIAAFFTGYCSGGTVNGARSPSEVLLSPDHRPTLYSPVASEATTMTPKSDIIFTRSNEDLGTRGRNAL